jgi:hypothetical protein
MGESMRNANHIFGLGDYTHLLTHETRTKLIIFFIFFKSDCYYFSFNLKFRQNSSFFQSENPLTKI